MFWEISGGARRNGGYVKAALPKSGSFAKPSLSPKNLPWIIFNVCIKFGGSQCRYVQRIAVTQTHRHRQTDRADRQTHRHTDRQKDIHE